MSAPSSGSMTRREHGASPRRAGAAAARSDRPSTGDFTGRGRVISASMATRRARRPSAAALARRAQGRSATTPATRIYLELARRRTPAGHRRDRRDARPAPQHRAPAPRPDARGRPARRHHRRAAARSAGPQHRYSLAADAPSLGLEPPTDADARPHGAGDGRSASTPARRRRRRRSRPRARPAPPATPRPRRRSRRSSPTSTASASTRSSAADELDDARHRRRRVRQLPLRRARRDHPELVCGLHRGPRRRVRRRDGRRRGRRVLPARPPHAVPGRAS